MAHETSKTIHYLGDGFLQTYFQSSVLDIGCGTDPVVKHAKKYDRMYGDGDAGELNFTNHGQMYDCVYSSHCLEHMEDYRKALDGWWSLVKPGGYLIVTVPDSDLYECGYWPSVFNREHRWRFSLQDGKSASNLLKLDCEMRRLRGATLISAAIHDYGYDYSHKHNNNHFLEWSNRYGGAHFLVGILYLLCLKSNTLYKIVANWLKLPVDQTQGKALAQIQVICKKNIYEQGVIKPKVGLGAGE